MPISERTKVKAVRHGSNKSGGKPKVRKSKKSVESGKNRPKLSVFLGMFNWRKKAQRKSHANHQKEELSKIPTAHRHKSLKSISTQPRIPGEIGKRLYCAKLMKGFAPFRFFAILTGHFPFTYSKNKDGTYEFRFQWIHWSTLLYIVNGIFTIAFLLSGIITIFSITSRLKIFKHQKRPIQKEILFYELVLIKRHYVFLWSLTAAGFCSVIALVHIFINRNYLPSIYSYYFRVVRLLHLDLHEGTKTSGLVMIAFYLITTAGVYIMGICKFAPMTGSVPLIVGDFMYGHFFGVQDSEDEIWILENDKNIRLKLQILGAITLFIIYISSKATILLFIFHCKVLRNAFAGWNGRAYIYMMKSAKYMVTEEGAERLKLIYKDHCLILDLMEGLNTSFAFVIETFYALQMGAAFFELYFCVRTAYAGYTTADSEPDGGNYFIRPNDWAPGVIILVQTLVFVIVTSKAASDVGEEALAGVDIVRRRMFLRRKTDEDLFFQLSMQNSFDSYRRFDIAGGHYGYINKDFIQGWINTMAGYFIILYQFQPLMDESHTDDPAKRGVIGKFLQELEGLPNDWEIAPPIASIITNEDLVVKSG